MAKVDNRFVIGDESTIHLTEPAREAAFSKAQP